MAKRIRYDFYYRSRQRFFTAFLAASTSLLGLGLIFALSTGFLGSASRKTDPLYSQAQTAPTNTPIPTPRIRPTFTPTPVPYVACTRKDAYLGNTKLIPYQTVAPGSQLDYAIYYQNLTANTIDSATVSDILPASVDPNPYYPNDWINKNFCSYDYSLRKVTCTKTVIQPGDEYYFGLKVITKSSAAGLFTNTARVASNLGGLSECSISLNLSGPTPTPAPRYPDLVVTDITRNEMFYQAKYCNKGLSVISSLFAISFFNHTNGTSAQTGSVNSVPSPGTCLNSVEIKCTMLGTECRFPANIKAVADYPNNAVIEMDETNNSYLKYFLMATPYPTAVSIAPPTSTPKPVTNLILNPTFDLADSNNYPTYWSKNNNFRRVAGGIDSKYMGKLTYSGTKYSVGLTISGIKVQQVYTFNGVVNIPPVSTQTSPFVFKMVLNWRNANNTVLRQDNLATYKLATAGWQKVYKPNLVAPVGATNARLFLTLDGYTTLYVDRFSLN